MRSRRAFLAAAAVGLGLLSGCVGPQVDDHSYQFNEATGSLGLRLLLLNAVRASKDYPLQFSKINAYQGTGTMGASVSATMPLRVFPSNGGSITPKVDWKDGISQINLIDLNTEEAQQALKKVIPFKVFEYYSLFSGSRSIGVVNMLMIEHVIMSRNLHSLIGESVKKQCDEYLAGKRTKLDPARLAKKTYACAVLDSFRAECSGILSPVVLPSGNVILRSDLTSECRHKAFAAGGLQFYILGFVTGAAPKPGADSKKDAKKDTKKAPGNTFNIYVAEPKEGGDKQAEEERGVTLILDEAFGEKCRRLAPESCPLSAKDHLGIKGAQGVKMSFQFRSPERMVRYLGELIAAQSYGADRFVPTAVDPELQDVLTLLTVVRGAPPQGGAAVAVRDPDGEVFYVPKPRYDLPRKDRSLEVLAIVSDVLNGAVSKKAFPQVTTFTVSPTP